MKKLYPTQSALKSLKESVGYFIVLEQLDQETWFCQMIYEIPQSPIPQFS